MARLRNPHPGEILKEEFLNAIGMSQNQLAHTIGVPGNRIARKFNTLAALGHKEFAAEQGIDTVGAEERNFPFAYRQWTRAAPDGVRLPDSDER